MRRGRQGGATGRAAGRAAGYTAQRASGRASGRAMMWDDSHTDHVRVSVRDTRSGPLWIENRVIHISGISQWISTRLIHLVGINECITWGYPLACVNVNLPLGKQRATGTFVVEKLRTFPRSDAGLRGADEGRIRVTHSPAHMPWISSRDKLDPAKAQLRGVSKWTLSRPGVTIQEPRASIGRRNGRIHREKRPFRHARSHTRSRPVTATPRRPIV